MNKLLPLILFFIYNICNSQTGGEKTYLFLKTPIFAHINALGGKTLTLTNNVNQPTLNPSVINIKNNNQISISYLSYLSGISSGSISYSFKFTEQTNPFHFNITYFNYGKMIEADEYGNETGNFSANDIALSVGYAIKISDTNFKFGTNLRFIHSNIANYNSTGLTTDLGLTYLNPKTSFIFSLVAKNIGTQLSNYNKTKESLPFEIAFGASYKMEKVPIKWHLTFSDLQKWKIAVPNPSEQKTDFDGTITKENISFTDNLIRHLTLGTELFAEKKINIRLGYNFRRGEELKLQNTRSFAGLSFGLGIRLKRIRLNYTFSKYHIASNTNNFSITVNLNKTKTNIN